jgi:Domain of unknown function (DUF1844)
MSEQDKGFTVKDRRRFDSEGTARPESEDSPRSEAPQASPSPEPPAAAAEEPAPSGEAQEEAPRPRAGQRHQLPPVDFSGLILSLAHATMMHLGQIPDPSGRPVPADLELARHTIDTIAMLKEKTKGNLSPEEQKLVDTALTELRMAFVQIAG